LRPWEELSYTQTTNLSQQHHPNPKTTTNETKTPKTKLFHELPWMLYGKMKMKMEGEE